MPKLFAIKDLKADVYQGPFFATNAAEAIRNVAIVVQDEKSLLAKFPEDFALYWLGELDVTDGSLIPAVKAEMLVPCSQLKRAPAQEVK